MSFFIVFKYNAYYCFSMTYTMHVYKVLLKVLSSPIRLDKMHVFKWMTHSDIQFSEIR